MGLCRNRASSRSRHLVDCRGVLTFTEQHRYRLIDLDPLRTFRNEDLAEAPVIDLMDALRAWTSAVLLLVSADELRLADHMTAHRRFEPDQHERVAAHVAWDQHRLSQRAQRSGQARMAGAESPRRVNTNHDAVALNRRDG